MVPFVRSCVELTEDIVWNFHLQLDSINRHDKKKCLNVIAI